MKAIWTPELVKQCLDVGFTVDEDNYLGCVGINCTNCPLENNRACRYKDAKENSELLTILQTHFPEHLL